MSSADDVLFRAILVGVGGTVVLDLWAEFLARVMGVPATNWAMVGRWLGMYPIDTAIVNACHSGQGGTGDVAILTAANRMTLMPFAQIATRIGGAITVTLVLITLSRIS